ncbi:hypothetical protein [Microbacterium imperiale]|uniref:hypothetical protein n=1 Tax=Microbacterium imperiale TaxID=33884 RepID=UPI001AE9A23A|nr:hypothetical protein [Microbacterium imperiale]MBP2419989.1 biopolymer transport protein ExbB/TolQ [Microbacterium imperiale]MDS0198147.1 hypothetical protein [Microbacterium imperiale]
MENWIGIITALGGLGAIALFFREIVAIVKLLRNGVAARESRRKNDIIAQRDAAIAERDAANQRAAAAEARTDRERENRRLVEGLAARLERKLILAGGTPDPWPDIDETTEITKT